jgi:polysaccharide export outer membrane protein
MDDRMGEDMRAKMVFWVCFLMLLVGAAGIVMAEEDRYCIGPGDVLEISVWKDENLMREVVVPPDGVISFPLIGDIDVTRLTTTDLRKTIKERLSEYVPDATVNVMLLAMNSLKAYVIGKVNKPGEFPISMDTHVMKILSMAGGLNPFASKGNILILRQENGKTTKIPFNYGDVEDGDNLGQNIVLKRGDVVVVP